MGKKDEARTVRKAGEKIWTARARAGQVTTHGFESSTKTMKLAGQELAFGERPAMDRNRRP